MKMKLVGGLAAILLQGCTTTEEARQKPIAFEGVGVASVEKAASCVASHFRQIKGGMVTTDPIDGGLSVAYNVRGQFGNLVWIIADIDAYNDKTRLIVRGIGHKSKQPEIDYAPYRNCLS